MQRGSRSACIVASRVDGAVWTPPTSTFLPQPLTRPPPWNQSSRRVWRKVWRNVARTRGARVLGTGLGGWRRCRPQSGALARPWLVRCWRLTRTTTHRRRLAPVLFGRVRLFRLRAGRFAPGRGRPRARRASSGRRVARRVEAADAKRREAVVVLQSTEFALDRGAAPVEVFPAFCFAGD